jgi:tetratricopeptide (TPR) repeat protein
LKDISSPAAIQKPAGRKYWHFGICLGLILCGWLAYQGSLQNGFVYDDNGQIVRNPFLHSSQPWTRIFTTDVWGYVTGGKTALSNYYRPLQILTYRAVAQSAGLNPYSFHLTNLFFHILVVVSLYWLFWVLLRDFYLAAGSALLFCLHPIHSEAVDWIAALPELGATLFYLLAFLFLVLALQQAWGIASFGFLMKPHGKAENYHLTFPRIFNGKLLLSLVCFALSLLWKEMAVTLPVLIFVFYLWAAGFRGPWKTRLTGAVGLALPYLFIVLVYMAARSSVLGYQFRVTEHSSFSLVQLLLVLPILVATYLGLLIWPVPLNAYRLTHVPDSFWDVRFGLACFVLLLFLAALYWTARKAPLPAFFLAWILLTLLPVLNLMAIGGPNKLAERYLYLPSVGACLFLYWVSSRALKAYAGKQARLLGFLLLLAVTGTAFFLLSCRHPDWKDDYTFFRRTLESSPDAIEMRVALAGALRNQRGDLEASERESKKALELALKEVPVRGRNIINATINLISIKILRGQFQEAWKLIEQALPHEGENPPLEFQLVKGICLVQMNRLPEARLALEKAYQFSPTNEQVLQFLGLVDLKEGKPESAIPFFQKALSVLPKYFDAHNNLATAYAMTNRWPEALFHFQKAATLSPRDPGVETNLALVLIRLNRIQEARRHLEKALALSPGFAPALQQWNRLQQPGRAPVP